MLKHNRHDEFIELASKYLSGNADKQELSQLEDWVMADPAMFVEFQELKRSWMLSAVPKSSSQLDVNKEWESLSSDLEGFKVENSSSAQTESGTKISRLKLFYRAAAAILILVAATLWLNRSFSDTGGIEMVAQVELLEETLPDGTQVSLNQHSKLTFLPIGKDNQRKAKLEGDAFFDVAQDEVHPFVIEAMDVEIEVLGTSFYVDARENQNQVQVIVKSGRVAVRKGNQEVVLTAGESGIFDKKVNTLIKQENRDKNYLAWKTNTLSFENTSLKEVVFALNRQFGSTIELESANLADCTLSATYKDKNLDAVLRIITQSLELQLKKKGEIIVLYGDGC